mmetsp:Transcript_4398/g.12043  ORF Transcript_4398/g.12043 Transcript_4398/m.12043 type:complete len:233 (+) Transcript_4398:910-1608(+)
MNQVSCCRTQIACISWLEGTSSRSMPPRCIAQSRIAPRAASTRKVILEKTGCGADVDQCEWSWQAKSVLLCSSFAPCRALRKSPAAQAGVHSERGSVSRSAAVFFATGTLFDAQLRWNADANSLSCNSRKIGRPCGHVRGARHDARSSSNFCAHSSEGSGRGSPFLIASLHDISAAASSTDAQLVSTRSTCSNFAESSRGSKLSSTRSMFNTSTSTSGIRVKIKRSLYAKSS